MATVKQKCVVHELVLTLNLEEAQVLVSVLDKIGGPVGRYPRQVCENINEALKDAGVEAAALKCQNNLNAIYFE